jgi:O-antigen ligase
VISAVLGAVNVVDIGQMVVPNQSVGRLGGPFGNPNYLGFAMVVGVPAAFASCLTAESVRRRAITGAACGFLVVVLFLTYSRGSAIAGLTGMVFVFAALGLGWRGRLLRLSIALVTLGVAITLMLPTYQEIRTNADLAPLSECDRSVRLAAADCGAADGLSEEFKRQQEAKFVQSRRDVLGDAYDAFTSAPILGIGWERFPSFASKRHPDGAGATHNEYARIAAETGLLGVLALLVMISGALRGAFELSDRSMRVAVGAMLLTGAVSLLFINGLVTPAAGLLLAVATGLAASSRQWVATDHHTVDRARSLV